MTALIICCVVLLIIALLQLGGEAVFDDSGLRVWLCIGPLKKLMYPAKNKKNGKKTEKKNEKKVKKRKEKEETPKGGETGKFRSYLEIISDVLGNLKKRIIIKKLTVYFTAAAEDPAAAALYFGAASAGAGTIVPLLQNNFRVKETDIRNSVDFNADKPKVYINADIRITTAALIAIGFRLLRIIIENRNKKGK